MRTVRVHGDGLQLGDYDEVKVSKGDCTDHTSSPSTNAPAKE
jgi:hypothetical protein